MSRSPHDPKADLEMIQAVVRQEPGGWLAFFKKHERLILACLRRVYGRYHVPLPQEEMEDLVGAVCLDLVREDYRKLRLFDPEKGYRLSSWVGLIATNIAHDALRRKGPPQMSTDEAENYLTELRSTEPDPLETVDLKEKVEFLGRAVRQLTATDQEFVRLYYAEQRSPNEIARMTGVSVNTIYSRKNKVRAKLIRLVRDITTPKRGDRS